jgi:hypothetical protein
VPTATSTRCRIRTAAELRGLRQRSIVCSLAVVALLAALGPSSAFAQQPWEALLDQHRVAMADTARTFAAQTVVIEATEGLTDGELEGERITYTWQQGRFREEWRQLGFTEVFGYDGADYWYGSELNLPYGLDWEGRIDVGSHLTAGLAYLAPEYAGSVGPPPADVPLDLELRYDLLLFTPPDGAEILLLLDRDTRELAGYLLGLGRTLAASQLYKVVTRELPTAFEAARYPAVVRTITYDTAGEALRERVRRVLAVSTAAPLPETQFSRASAPQVPSIDLSGGPLEVPFQLIEGSVVIPVTSAGGRRLKLEFDSGASVGFLRRDVAADLGLSASGGSEVTGHGGNAQVEHVRVEGMTLGSRGIALPAWPAAVLPAPAPPEPGRRPARTLDDALKRNDIDGLIGNYLLSQCVVSIDYPRRRITLYDPATFDPATDLGPGAYSVAVKRDSQPYFQVEIDDAIVGGGFVNTGAALHVAGRLGRGRRRDRLPGRGPGNGHDRPRLQHLLPDPPRGGRGRLSARLQHRRAADRSRTAGARPGPQPRPHHQLRLGVPAGGHDHFRPAPRTLLLRGL